MKTQKNILTALFATVAMATCAGWNSDTETYDTTDYVSLKTLQSKYSDATPFEIPSYWTWPKSYETTPSSMQPNEDYCYESSSMISRTPNTRDFTFNARTLAVNGQFHQSSTHYFTMTNMHLIGGGKFVIWGQHSRFSNCTFTVYAREKKPFLAEIAVSGGSRADGFVFANTKIRGDAKARMNFVGSREKQTCAAYHWTGDGSDYLGTIYVDMLPAVTNPASYALLELGSVNFGGTIALGSRGRLRAYQPTPCCIASLTAEEGAAIEFGTGLGAIEIAAKPSFAAPLKVLVDVNLRPPSPIGDQTILSAPSGSFTTNDFILGTVGSAASPDWASLKVTDDGKTAALTIRQNTAVMMTNCGTRASSPFAAGNGACWSDGLEPHADSDYVMPKGSVYFQNNISEYDFPGDSLTLGTAGTLTLTSPGEGVSTMHCRKLICEAAYIRRYGGYDFLLDGGSVDIPGWLKADIYSGSVYTFTIASELTGAGTLILTSYPSETASKASGSFALTAANTNYMGRIRVTMPSKTLSYGEVPADTMCATLYIDDVRALGAPLAAFTPDALQLEQYGILKPTRSLTIDTPNRGIRISGCGRVETTADTTLTISNAITYAGVFRKEGDGTLALAAAPRFLSGKDGEAPLAGTNVFEVKSGSAKPLSTNCLEGVNVRMSSTGALLFDIAPTSEGLRDFGIVNLTEPNGVPLELSSDNVTKMLNIRFDTADYPDAPPADDWQVALFTVPQAAADAILQQLRVHKAYPTCEPLVGTRKNADGSTTVFVTHHQFAAATVTPKSASTPIYSSKTKLVIPEFGHIVFSGWTASALSNACVTVASAPSYQLPANWLGWTWEPAIDGYSLSFAVEDGTIVARMLPDIHAYARQGGSLVLSNLGKDLPFKFRVGTVASTGHYTPTGENDYAFTNVTSCIVKGDLSVRQYDERTARATWTFTPSESLTSNVIITLNPTAAYGFKCVATNGVDITIKIKKSVTVTNATNFSFKSTDESKDFTLEFDSPTKVYAALYESLSSNLKIYCCPPATGFAKGETYSIAFNITANGAVKAKMPPVVTFAANDEWIPTTAAVSIAPGGVFDFTDLCGTGKPAGKHGRVIRVGDHFEFENRRGVPVKFWGITQGSSQYVADPSLRDPGLADFARRGYNATRVHDYEDAIVDKNDPSRTSFDEENMRLFDGYIASSISNGMFVILELYGNHRTPAWRSIGEDRDGNITRDQAKSLLVTHEGMISNQLEYIRAYLTHVNCYTGRSFVDEPAIIGADLVNEQTLGISRVQDMGTTAGLDLKQAWAQCVAKGKAEDPTTWSDVDGSTVPKNTYSTKAGRLYCQMIREKLKAFENRVRKFIREELKCNMLLTNIGDEAIAYQEHTATCRDYIDTHYYQDHPTWLENDWSVPTGFRHKNNNAITYKDLGAPSNPMKAHRGYPLTVTEFNYCAPSNLRMIGGFMMGGIAALQGFDGLWQHSLAFQSADKRTSNFSILADPLMPAWSRAAAMLYARGDLPPLTNEYVTVVDSTLIRSADESARSGYDVADAVTGRLAWYARLGIAITNEPPKGVACCDWPTALTNTEQRMFASLGIARDKDGLPPIAGDGRIRIDDIRGSVEINTERTCGGFAENGALTAGVFAVELGNVPAAVWVTSCDGKPLTKSRRMTLSYLTDVQDTGSKFLDDTYKEFLSWGSLPHLMRRARGTVRLATGAGLYRVFALAADGTRRYEVSVTRTADGIVLEHDTASDPAEATYLYEIVRLPGLVLRLR